MAVSLTRCGQESIRDKETSFVACLLVRSDDEVGREDGCGRCDQGQSALCDADTDMSAQRLLTIAGYTGTAQVEKPCNLVQCIQNDGTSLRQFRFLRLVATGLEPLCNV